jgi:hypothetical protein
LTVPVQYVPAGTYYIRIICIVIVSLQFTFLKTAQLETDRSLLQTNYRLAQTTLVETIHYHNFLEATVVVKAALVVEVVVAVPCRMRMRMRMSHPPHKKSPSILCLVLLLLGILICLPTSCWAQQVVLQEQNNYTFDDLEPCALNTAQISQLGPNEDIEPCVVFQVQPNEFYESVDRPTNNNNASYSTIRMVQVTPSNCGNHRDGSVTGVESLNADNGGRGVAIGFQEDHYVTFHLISVIAGNPATLSEGEYARRHVQLLSSMLTSSLTSSLMSSLDMHTAPYIIGSCSFASAMEQEPAREHKAILMAQVGPPGFYTEGNPYVFGFHINSDTYPLPSVQSLGFWANDQEGGPASIPVRVIYRSKSEFFYSTCRSAIDRLKEAGFTNIKEILYDHAADHDEDGEINEFDQDFLVGLADEACPPDSSSDDRDFHPALFACTLTEHDTIVRRWVENGCRPVSTWITASTWGWANDNLDEVPYYQGGGQWHEQFSYSDRYFEKGRDLLIHNQAKFGYFGNYDQVVSYAIPVLYAQHLISHYRVIDTPDPIADFADEEGRERLRRGMLVLNVETLFGPVAFNEFQRNIGRGAAGTQWLPRNDDVSFANALVAPFLQAEASTFIPALSAVPCQAGDFVNDIMRVEQASVLASGCAPCPVDTYTLDPSEAQECTPCRAGSSTEGMEGQDKCYVFEDNLLSEGILAFGYTATTITWILSISFISWLFLHRDDPVVRVSQIEFLVLICIGAMISSSTVIALSFQAGTDDDVSAATAGCTAAPFLYAIGWVLQYSSLSAKTLRLFTTMTSTKRMKRVTVTAIQMSRIVVAALAVDLTILICWTIYSPLVVRDIVRAYVVSCYCRRGHHSHIFIYLFAVRT